MTKKVKIQDNAPFLTVPDAAKLRRPKPVSPQAILDDINAGRLKAGRHGRYWYILPADFEAFQKAYPGRYSS